MRSVANSSRRPWLRRVHELRYVPLDGRPEYVYLYENWASRPLWERHMQSPHLKAFPNNTEGMVEVWELFLGEKVVNP